MGALEGQVAVVTGAGAGIGRGVALALAGAGASVAVSDIDGAAAEAVAAEAASLGPATLAVATDVAEESAVVELASRCLDSLGPVTCWVNNAGVSMPGMLHTLPVDDFDRVWAVHGRGTFLGIRQAARQMKTNRIAGSIVNVTSAAGLEGTVGQINYAAAKGAIAAMTRSAARELGRDGIRVNAVSPAAATQMTERVRADVRFAGRYLERIVLGRWAEPAEVAQVFVFLASSASSYVTGQILCVDGGMTMVR